MSVGPVGRVPTQAELDRITLESEALANRMNAIGASCLRAGPMLSEEEMERAHIDIAAAYRRVMGEIEAYQAKCKGLGGRAGDFEVPEEHLALFLGVSTVYDRVAKSFANLNHAVRTSHPLVRIEQFTPRVSPMKPIGKLIAETRADLHPLLSQFGAYREIAGDGNCFFTSFTVRFLESISRDEGAIAQFIEFISEQKIEDPRLKELVVQLLLEISQYPSQLETILSDNNRVLPVVRLLREVTYQHLLTASGADQDNFRYQLADEFREHEGEILSASYPDLLRDYVLQMGCEATRVPIHTLCQILKFPVRIQNPSAPSYFRVFDAIEGESPRAEFMRSGHHYFIVYPPEAPGVKELSEGIPPPGSEPAPGVGDPRFPMGRGRSGVVTTELSVTYEIPFGHALFVRGSGAGLQWDKGIPLRAQPDGTWKLPFDVPPEGVEFKILYDDEIWEEGGNHRLQPGVPVKIEPRFALSAERSRPPGDELELIRGEAAAARLPSAQAASEIVVRAAVPFGHALFIRGSGSGLSWERGIPLQEQPDGTWRLPVNIPTSGIEYKILYDDEVWEKGENRKLMPGANAALEPQFDLTVERASPVTLEAPPLPRTRIAVRAEAGAGNKLFVRGEGIPGLRWDAGIEMRQESPGLWVWETEASDVRNANFKILRNDRDWERGDNHRIEHGQRQEIVVRF
jgi:hypothetical protein